MSYIDGQTDAVEKTKKDCNQKLHLFWLHKDENKVEVHIIF